jgi:hypothetical protein
MKKQMTVVVSPKATAAYAWLAKPDEGQQYSDGKYKVTLVLEKSDPEVKKFIEKLTEIGTALGTEEFGKLPKTFKMAYKDGDDAGKEEFEGKWLIVAKTKYQPGFVDAAKKALPEGVTPMSGDVIRASFGLSAYKAGGGMGVSCQLRNVMLLEKRNSGGGGDDFADVESGAAFEGAMSSDEDEDFDI